MKNRFIPYFGNKRKEFDNIDKQLPHSFDVFVDVFGGSGSVSINVKDKYNCNVFYNDTNQKLIRLINIFRNADDNLIKNIEEFNYNLIYKHKNIEEGKKYLDNLYNSLKHDDMKFIMKCFFSKLQLYLIQNIKIWQLPFNKKGFYNSPSKIYFDDYINTYSKIDEITNKDYKEVLEKYKNDENTVLYLDPPYLTKKITYGSSFNQKDIDYIIDFMKNCNCKILINPNFDEYYNNKIDDRIFLKEVYNKKYESRNKDNHCIITNY